MLDIIAVYKIMRKILNGVMLLLLSITREKSKYFSNILETNQKHECLHLSMTFNYGIPLMFGNRIIY